MHHNTREYGTLEIYDNNKMKTAFFFDSLVFLTLVVRLVNATHKGKYAI